MTCARGSGVMPHKWLLALSPVPTPQSSEDLILKEAGFQLSSFFFSGCFQESDPRIEFYSEHICPLGQRWQIHTIKHSSE